MGNISKNFSFHEFFTEGRKVQEMVFAHIPNIYQRIKDRLVNPILQPMRDFLGEPITITSGYRSQSFNASLKKANINSHHLFGGKDRNAVDIWTEHLDIAWEWLKKNRKKICYAYMDLTDPNPLKHWIHITGLNSSDPRIGIMWIDDKDGRHWEPDPPKRKAA